MRHMLLMACLLLAQAAQAAGRLAQVVVIDRDSGSTLPIYYHRGEYWIPGKPGAHYASEIRNTLHERLLAVTSVDGINVLSGDTARWDQGGYVLGAQESYQITGWRKSQTEVASFEFAAAPNSYAARTGRSANIGVSGVTLFRERLPEPPPEQLDYAPAAPNRPAPAPPPVSSAESRMEGQGSSTAGRLSLMGTQTSQGRRASKPPFRRPTPCFALPPARSSTTSVRCPRTGTRWGAAAGCAGNDGANCRRRHRPGLRPTDAENMRVK